MGGVGQDRVRTRPWQGEFSTIVGQVPRPVARAIQRAIFRGKMPDVPKCGNVVDKAPWLTTFWPFDFWLPSSMVEQLTLNQLVPGSSPGGATTSCFLPVTLVRSRSNALPA